jgi:FkbM family methyltransferase
MNRALRRLLAAAAIRLGPANPLVRLYLASILRRGKIAGRFDDSVIELQRGQRIIKLHSRHFPFIRDIADNFDSLFSTLESTDNTLDFSVPAVHRYIPSGLEFFMSSMPEEIAAIDSYFIHASPQPGSLVFDIGANCGVTAHRLATMTGPTGRVIAFEPDPVNHAALLENIRRHNLTNVIPVRKGIAPETGRLTFNCEGTLGAGLASFIARPTVGDAKVIECLSLADAVKQFGQPSFVKMDVEGAELAVLNSNADFLKRCRCPYALDTAHIVDGRATAERVEEIFRACGYKTGTEHKYGSYVTTWAVPD